MEENLSCNVPVHRPYGQTHYIDRPSAKRSSHQQAPPQHNYDQLRHLISISSFLRVTNWSEMGQAMIDTPTYQSTDCLETSKWFSDKNSFETGLWFRQQITECSWKIKSVLSGEEVWLLFSNQGIFLVFWGDKQPRCSLFRLSFAEKNGPSDSLWYFGNIKLSKIWGHLTG